MFCCIFEFIDRIILILHVSNDMYCIMVAVIVEECEGLSTLIFRSKTLSC